MTTSAAVWLLSLSALVGVAHADDHYSVLGLGRGASASEVKRAFHKASLRLHPDKPGGDEAAFRRVADAYDVLSDPEKKRLYDLHGDAGAQIHERRHRQQQQQQQQFARQRGQHFFDPFGRRQHARAAPIFSVTPSMTNEILADLLDSSSRPWLLQFYHDWSTQCIEFGPKWEALAERVPPMVRLARVNIERNLAMVRRFQRNLRCQQLGFTIECVAPTLLLVWPTDDSGETTAATYPGRLGAEPVYEWIVANAYTSSPRAVSVPPNDQGVAAFLAGRLRRGRGRGAANEAPPRGLLVSSSRKGADTLFTRALPAWVGQLELGFLHAEGGLESGSEAAAVARRLGIAEVPSIAIWPPRASSAAPRVIAIGEYYASSEGRRDLLAEIARAAAPPVAKLGPSTYHATCGARPGAEPRVCLLLLVPPRLVGSVSVAGTLDAMRDAAAQLGSDAGVGFAWVDADRQRPFVRHVAPDESSLPAATTQADGAVLIALRGGASTRRGGGLARVETARSRLHLGESASEAEAILGWLTEVRGSKRGGWRSMPGNAPPLRADDLPGAAARLRIWVVHSHGWLVLAILGGLCVSGFFFYDEVAATLERALGRLRKAWAAKPEPRAAPRAAETRADATAGVGARARQAEAPRTEPATASREVFLTTETVDAVLSRTKLVLCFGLNAGCVDAQTVRALARHFSDALSESFSVAILDVASEAAKQPHPAELTSLLRLLRSVPCVVVHSGRRVVVYEGHMTVAALEEWLARLRMGELHFQGLGEASNSGGAGQAT